MEIRMRYTPDCPLPNRETCSRLLRVLALKVQVMVDGHH